MYQKTFFLALAALLVAVATTSEARAWGCAHVGYTHVGAGGAYHYGGTAAYGGGAYHYGSTAAYGGAYHYGGYSYGGYHTTNATPGYSYNYRY
jgi:hypothetical protein